MKFDSTTYCLCGSGFAYGDCCQPFHLGEKIPATAQALMRSRYTAYALRDAAYLQATWDATKRPERIDFSRENIAWLRLEIIEIKKGGVQDNKGLVTFKAYYSQEGDEYVMNEISRFTKHEGRWFYLDGTIKTIGKIGGPVNLGKNAPCHCGSGKKFKRCCGAEK
jgi:SEC-C motif-containing protein